MTTSPNTGDSQNQSLSAHKVAIIADNIKHYDEKSRNLINVVDSDINFTRKGTSFSSNSYSDVGFKSVARSARFTDHNTERLKRGKRQANFADFENAVEESNFEIIEEMVDPLNALNKKMGQARNDFRDPFIMQNMFAAQLEAVDDATDTDKLNLLHKMQTVAFPTANIVGVDYAGYYDGKSDGKAAPSAADQGLTKGKLLGGRKILAKRRKKGRLILACTEDDILNLATSMTLTSTDFVTPKLLMDIEKVLAEESDIFLGMTFKVLFPDSQVGYGTNAAECGLFVGDAIEYRESTIVSLRHDQLPTRHYNHQLYEAIRAACLRNDDTCVAKILVNHTDTPVE